MERVVVVEDDDTKNNRPFRLQIKFTNDGLLNIHFYLLADADSLRAKEELQKNRRKMAASILSCIFDMRKSLYSM